MADWRTMDWQRLDTNSLVMVLNAVLHALTSRLVERYPFQSTPTPAAPPAMFASAPSETGFSVVDAEDDDRNNGPAYTFGPGSETLLTPYACPYRCRWCQR